MVKQLASLLSSWLPFGSAVFLLLVSTCAAQEPGKDYAEEYIQTFKEPLKNATDFTVFGPDPQCVKLEPGGLRLTFPAGQPPSRPTTGLGSNFGVRGDFEITLTYEILQEPEAADAGTQTRFAVSVMLDKPGPQDQSALNRRVTGSGPQFFAWRSRKDEAGRPRPLTRSIPAQAKTGRLRMVRDGADLAYFAAEGDGAFVFLDKFTFGADDLRTVAIVGATGGPQAALDVRLTELRLRAAGFPKPAPPPPPVVTAPTKVYAAEFRQPLTVEAQSIPGFEIIGPGKNQSVRHEAAGLRITLPPGWNGERPSSGLVSRFAVKGDFEITASFEVLSEPTQADAGTSGGTRLNLALIKDTPAGDVSNINRTMSTRLGRSFFAWSTPIVGEAGQKKALGQPLPTEALTGRLCLVRSGADWFYGASEGPADIKFFARFPFGPEDIRQVRLIGATGGSKAALDVRFTDLSIRADAISGAPAAAEQAVPQADAAQPLAKGWLAAMVIVVSLTLMVLGGAVALWRSLRTRPRQDREVI